MNNPLKSLWERFNRLTYVQRFTVITIIFILPVIAFIPLLNDQITRIDHYGHKELSGTLYLRPVWQLTEDMQSFVISTQGYSKNKTQLSEVQKAQSSVETDFENLEKVNNEYSGAFLLASQPNALRTQWSNIQTAVQNKDWKNFDAQQTLLLKNLDDLTAKVGDASYLILDPDLDTYYTMDTVLLKLPENQSLLFEIRQISEQAANDGSFSAENKAQLTSLIGRVAANLDAMKRNIDVALQNDQTGSMTQLVSSPLDEYQASLRAFTDFVGIEMNKPAVQSDFNSGIKSKYESAQTADTTFYTAASHALELGITHRINSLTVRLYWMTGIALLSIIIAFVVGRSIMQSISLPLIQLSGAAKRLAAGEMTVRVPTGESNELGQVANAFNQMATELERDKSSLLARTTELNTARLQSEKRAQDLQIISEISRISSSEARLDILLPLVARIVGEKFNLYHTAIFLVDENHEFAVLQAANTQSGQQMFERGYKVELGPFEAVGSVAATGKPRIILNAADEALVPHTSILPNTRSELALPLLIAGEVIGVLDVQSTEVNAFQQEHMDALSTLADQFAIAIQNARLLEQTRRALQKAEIASSQLTEKAWNSYGENTLARGYRYDGIKPEALKNIEQTASETENTLLVPVQLRGQIIGRLKLRKSGTAHKWTEDERALIEATAERVAIALDGARLLDEAQKRATRETFLSELGAKLGTSFQLDSILRDTVEELGQSLKGSTVSFQLVNPNTPPSSRTNGNDRANGRDLE